MTLGCFIRNLAWNLVYRLSSEVGIEPKMLLQGFKCIDILWRCYMDNVNLRVQKQCEDYVKYATARVDTNHLAELDSTLDIYMRKLAIIKWIYEIHGLLEPPLLRLAKHEDGTFKLENVRNISSLVPRIDLDKVGKYYRQLRLSDLVEFTSRVTNHPKYRKIEEIYNNDLKPRIITVFDYAFTELVSEDEVKWRYSSGKELIPYIYRLINGARKVRDYFKELTGKALLEARLLNVEPSTEALLLEDRELIKIELNRNINLEEINTLLEKATRKINTILNDLYRDCKLIVDLYNKTLTTLTRKLKPFTLYYAGKVRYRIPLFFSLRLDEEEKELYIMNCLDHVELYINSTVPIVETFYLYKGRPSELYNINHCLELLLNISNIVKSEPIENEDLKELKEHVRKILHRYI
ncbi:MAG: hypothetical protein GXO26_05435 [Crenarchaeota archaeon]|nr:hypothetical protein [Thermoproteota archaeon]